MITSEIYILNIFKYIATIPGIYSYISILNCSTIGIYGIVVITIIV